MTNLRIDGGQLQPTVVQQLANVLPLHRDDRHAHEVFDGPQRQRVGLDDVQHALGGIDGKRPLEVLHVGHVGLHEDEEHVQQGAPVDLSPAVVVERFKELGEG